MILIGKCNYCVFHNNFAEKSQRKVVRNIANNCGKRANREKSGHYLFYKILMQTVGVKRATPCTTVSHFSTISYEQLFTLSLSSTHFNNCQKYNISIKYIAIKKLISIKLFQKNYKFLNLLRSTLGLYYTFIFFSSCSF